MLNSPCKVLLTLIAMAVSCVPAIGFQAREHLTPEEIDLVKDAQVLDKRIDVFIKAADRRLMVLTGTGDTSSSKQAKKDAETWGQMPTGTRAELIGDIAGIFDEAITNIDDVSSRDETNPLIAKSLRKLSAAATRIVEQLKPAEAQAKNDLELNSFDQLAENASAIIDAANRLPPPPTNQKSKAAKKTN